LKIFSGSKKSHVIRAPKNLSIVRPTSGLVKESLFNILSNYFIFNEIKVLDLYAGIGNISYEFGSRGCNEIDSVDINFRCTDFIKKMAKELNLKIKIFTLSVDKFIMKNESKYDIIFADPPYHISNIDKLIELCLDRLNPGGVFVLECSKKESIAGYNKISKFGGTNLLYWQV
jgi:16S rRNA (guanine(966)-N(2))-methyltransferase RsmD